MIIQTQYDQLTEEELIQQILEWAEEHDSFDTEFVESVSEAYDEYGDLTCAQREGLERIYARFRIGQWFKKKGM